MDYRPPSEGFNGDYRVSEVDNYKTHERHYSREPEYNHKYRSDKVPMYDDNYDMAEEPYHEEDYGRGPELEPRMYGREVDGYTKPRKRGSIQWVQFRRGSRSL